MKPRILIADDHGLMREALAMTILRCWPEADVEQTTDFPSAWAAATKFFDLCICDLTMPGSDAVPGIKQLFGIQPTLKLIAISGSADDATLRKVVSLNVAGLIPKTTDGAIVEAAIRLVLAGGKYLPDNIPTASKPSDITDTQKRVLELMCTGKTNKEIAKTLDVAPSTVNTHIDNILKRLKARNRVEACQKFSAMTR